MSLQIAKFYRLLGRIGLLEFTVLLCLLGLIFVRYHSFSADPGLGWHLKTGQWIAEHQSLPNKDPFLFSTSGKNWIPDQWLGDLLIYKLFAIGGWPLLYVILTFIYLYTFVYGLGRKLINQNKGGVLASSLTIVFAYYLAQVHFILRPVLLSFFLFFIVYFDFIKIATGQKINRILGIRLFVTIAAWVNIHPSYLLTWLLFFVLLFADFIVQPKSILQVLKKNGSLFAIIFFASLCSPWPLALFRKVLTLAFGQMQSPGYQEWLAPDLGLIESLFFVTPILLFIFSWRKLVWQNKPEGIFIILSSLLFAACALRAMRFFPYYALAIAPLLHICLWQGKSILPNYGIVSDVLRAAWQNLERRQSNKSDGKIFFQLSLFILLLTSLGSNKIPFYSGEFGPPRQDYPFQIIEFLNRQPKPLKVLNDINLGGFLIGWGRSGVQGFVDDRTTLHGQSFYDFIEKYWRPSGILFLVESTKADYLIIENSQYNQHLIRYFKIKQKNSIVLSDYDALLIDARKIKTTS